MTRCAPPTPFPRTFLVQLRHGGKAGYAYSESGAESGAYRSELSERLYASEGKGRQWGGLDAFTRGWARGRSSRLCLRRADPVLF